MDAYEWWFLVLMTLGMSVVGLLGGRLGRVGTWEAGVAMGLTFGGATAVALWRSFKE